MSLLSDRRRSGCSCHCSGETGAISSVYRFAKALIIEVVILMEDEHCLIAWSASNNTQLVFSYDANSLSNWDIALSKDLTTWKTISRDVDYRIILTEAWTPAGSSENLTRITLETMGDSSFDFEPGAPANFFKLVVTPSL